MAQHTTSDTSDSVENESTAILVAKGLCKQFNGFKAVSEVDLNVSRGHIHALIGPNGAGKTTCFNLLTKFLPSSAGTIHFNGTDITRKRPSEVASMGLVRSFQISAIFPKMTVAENVRIGVQRRRCGQSFDFWRSEKVLRELNDEVEQLLDNFELSDFSERLSEDLPYGRKRALELATTLALDPQMMLLDEPMAGIAHHDIEKVTELIRRAGRHRTILMVEHNLSVVSTLCDKITVLARGRVLADGDYATVSSDDRVIQAYMGTSAHE